MTTALIEAAIRELETYNKQGESYTDATGRYGWRNPIRADTGDLLRILTIAANPFRILEIGAGHGLSTLYLAGGLAITKTAVLIPSSSTRVWQKAHSSVWTTARHQSVYTQAMHSML